MPRRKIIRGGQDGGEEVDDVSNYELKKPENVSRLGELVADLPENAPPVIRDLLKNWGDAEIFKARICRVPLNAAIQRVGNFLTMGKLEQMKQKLGYNDLFHLYVEVALRKPDGRKGVFKIEKNEKAGYTATSGGVPPGATCLDQPPTRQVTLLEAFKRAEQSVGPRQLWVYDLGSSNCQDFAIAFLGSGNGMLTPTGRTFAKQEPAKLIPPLLLSATKRVTNLASRLRSLFTGRGLTGGAPKRATSMTPEQMRQAQSEALTSVASAVMESERRGRLNPLRGMRKSEKGISSYITPAGELKTGSTMYASELATKRHMFGETPQQQRANLRKSYQEGVDELASEWRQERERLLVRRDEEVANLLASGGTPQERSRLEAKFSAELAKLINNYERQRAHLLEGVNQAIERTKGKVDTPRSSPVRPVAIVPPRRSAQRQEGGPAGSGLKQACWKGYTAVGMKTKRGRQVPNCVPVSKGMPKPATGGYDDEDSSSDDECGCRRCMGGAAPLQGPYSLADNIVRLTDEHETLRAKLFNAHEQRQRIDDRTSDRWKRLTIVILEISLKIKELSLLTETLIRRLRENSVSDRVNDEKSQGFIDRVLDTVSNFQVAFPSVSVAQFRQRIQQVKQQLASERAAGRPGSTHFGRGLRGGAPKRRPSQITMPGDMSDMMNISGISMPDLPERPSDWYQGEEAPRRMVFTTPSLPSTVSSRPTVATTIVQSELPTFPKPRATSAPVAKPKPPAKRRGTVGGAKGRKARK